MQQLDRQRRFLYRLARCAAATVTAAGLAVIIGWIIDHPFLRGGFSPAAITVKTNAGIALLCCGLSLALQCFEIPRWALRLAQSLALLAFVLGALTLCEHLTDLDLGIDQLLFSEPAGQAATASPNRMGPPGCIMFMMAGVALLLLQSSSARQAPKRDLATPLAATIACIATISTLGYLYGATALYGIAKYTGISLFTAVTFIVLAIGIILALPFSASIRLLTAPTAGGIMVRRLLPAMLLPPILGYVRTMGEAAGWYDGAMGRALVNTLFMIIMAGLIWSAGGALDLTDRARRGLLEAERAARGEAERASRLKDEFLATLSHELRTPITAILGWSQLLARGDGTAEDLTEGIEVIARNARAQARIIDDLLDMSRIVSGKIHVEIEPVELGEIVQAAVASVAPMAQSREISIATAINSSSASVLGDAARLQQVFWNLLSNAVKFSPRGGLVQVVLEQRQSHVQVQVIDNGQGIRPEFLPHLFERFRQQDGTSTRTHGGLGLGLSIAKQLVEFHGGTIAAASAGEGEGAAFTVRLPLRFSQSPSAGATPTTPASDGELVNLKGVRILVVDDEADTRAIVSRLLQECFADVITADCADAALIAMRSQRPHILISDISMPQQDGYDLIRKIRDLPADQGGKTPAVALTAHTRGEDQARAKSAGYQVHMPKPIEPRQLIAAVATLAGKGNDSVDASADEQSSSSPRA
jgi:signal transduction histidine kinase/CheY-like chemotaxis protein